MKKISHRLGVLIGVCLLGVISLGIYSILSLRTTATSIRAAESKARVEGDIYNRIVQSKDVVADVLPPPGYVIESYLVAFQLNEAESQTDRDRFRAELGNLEKQFNDRLVHWKTTLPEGALKTAYANSSLPAVRFFQIINGEFLPAVAGGDKTRARQLIKTSLLDAYTAQRASVDKVVECAEAQDRAANAELKQVLRASEKDVGKVLRASTVRTLLCIAILAMALGFTGVRLSSRIASALKKVAGNIGSGTSEVVSAARLVSVSSQSLAEGSSEQAGSIQETSASLEEMASMTSRSAEHTQRANALAKEAHIAADHGVKDMQAMNTAMEAIKGSSNDIANVIKTIDEIAFQTNILALNAAVEAARAGEAGMGFAVVADEVRSLAQRSAHAAKETAGKIEAAVTNTSRGADISQKVAVALHEIVVKARQVDDLVTEVASASNEQAVRISQINNALAQVDKVTQTNAASAQESAAAAEELNSQAECMKGTVAELLELVGGDTVAPGDVPPSLNRTPITPTLRVAQSTRPGSTPAGGDSTQLERRSDHNLKSDRNVNTPELASH
jgi:methyl-accepting chemotaxis protein